jgi:signal transduction histidine kinase/FixJ family two-component response regulator
MNSPLRVLHLEDDLRDTELVQAILEGEGIQSELTRIETEHDFVAALKPGSFDLILADYTLPSLDGVCALKIARQRLPEVPFIFVSGTLGEDVAIEALKNGATDYVLKTRLARLGPSVTRALREAQQKAERDRAEEALRASEQLARGQVEALTFSLDVLATAPKPKKFIGQMLMTICRQLNAHSGILGLLNEARDTPVFPASAEGDEFTQIDPEHPFIKDPWRWKKSLLLQELLFTRSPVICEDIETDPRVDSTARKYYAPKGLKKFLAVPLLAGGQVKGFITVRHRERAAYRPEEIELTQALAHQVMLALQLTELAEQSRRTAILAERNRMGRDIHDTLAQGFTGVIVQLEAVANAISRSDPRKVNKCLQRASDLARRSLNEARRSVHALRPEALEHVNFWEALKGIIKNTAAATPTRTKLKLRGKLPQLRPDWQEDLMRIGQEALTNTLKYAHADTFETRLVCHANKLRLEFQDDGDGFNVKDRHDGVGLTGMRERVAQIGGELKITSARGKGTKITVVLPCNGGIDVIRAKRNAAVRFKKPAKKPQAASNKDSHARIATEKPKMISRTNQSGISKNGKTFAAIWTTSHPTTACDGDLVNVAPLQLGEEGRIHD